MSADVHFDSDEVQVDDEKLGVIVTVAPLSMYEQEVLLPRNFLFAASMRSHVPPPQPVIANTEAIATAIWIIIFMLLSSPWSPRSGRVREVDPHGRAIDEVLPWVFRMRTND